MANIKIQNDIRINISSFSKISKLKKNIKFDSKFSNHNNLNLSNLNLNLNNDKIININNFELKINDKKIKYSTYYTNPYMIKSNLVKDIKFKKTKNNSIKKLCDKIFLSKSSIVAKKQNFLNKSIIDNEITFQKNSFYNNVLEDFDNRELNLIVFKKNKFISKNRIGIGVGIGIEQSLLILWYIIYSDKFIELNNKQIYYNLIKYYYTQFVLDIFDFNEIIQGVINCSNILYKKFYISFYILAEEFHYTYIKKYLFLYNLSSNIIFNSNYIKINPQTLLNDFNNEIKHDLNSIDEEITNPFGHNILLIKSDKNKIYYYDPDEQILSDLYKFKVLFNCMSINFFNISNRTPIQTITDDANCVFYCVGFIKYLIQNNIVFELNKLILSTLLYESFILSTNTNIFKWSIKLN